MQLERPDKNCLILERIAMKKYIDLKLYATLNKFSPSSPEQYPVKPGTTVLSLIEKLGIPANQAKLVFINGVKCELTASLQGGERVGIFPPVGGG
jgi:sulfur-carrier protein